MSHLPARPEQGRRDLRSLPIIARSRSLVQRCGATIAGIRERLKKWWTAPVYFLFVDGMKPIPMTTEVAAEVEKIMGQTGPGVPTTLTMLWANGDKIRFRVDRISALTTEAARWRLGRRIKLKPAFMKRSVTSSRPCLLDM